MDNNIRDAIRLAIEENFMETCDDISTERMQKRLLELTGIKFNIRYDDQTSEIHFTCLRAPEKVLERIDVEIVLTKGQE